MPRRLRELSARIKQRHGEGGGAGGACLRRVWAPRACLHAPVALCMRGAVENGVGLVAGSVLRQCSWGGRWPLRSTQKSAGPPPAQQGWTGRG